VLTGGADLHASAVAGLILFALLFSCVYLLPAVMCEERERGLLLAQMLSPASVGEIIAARFVFHGAVGLALAVALAGIVQPDVFTESVFWLGLPVASVGFLGVGLTISSMARSQRSASMGALCYMLAVALFLFICQQAHMKGIAGLAVEYHVPRLLTAALSHAASGSIWMHVSAAALLGCAWCVIGYVLFWKRGWR
jgi:hypothetical protein